MRYPKINSEPLFQNVSQSNRSIHVSLNKDGTAYINLFDLYGRPVKNTIVNNTQITLDCSQLTPGIYILRVSQGNTTQTQKRSAFNKEIIFGARQLNAVWRLLRRTLQQQ